MYVLIIQVKMKKKSPHSGSIERVFKDQISMGGHAQNPMFRVLQKSKCLIPH
jgi:hypothetical protein